MNKHTIHGRLVRDPEITSGAEPKNDRCKFTVAVDRRFGDETDFFDCVMFGKRASVIDKYFRKGSEIILEGEGQLRAYDDKNGVRRKAYSIVVSEFDFCGSKADGQASAPTQEEPQPTFKEINEDIPF